MKIVASRRDDLLKAREEYDNNLAKVTEEHEAATRRYYDATSEQSKGIIQRLRSRLPESDKLDIRVSCRWGDCDIQMTYGENERNSTALRWSWRASLDANGIFSHESNSWSGLNATSPELVEDLKQSVAILDELSKVDWRTVLEQELKRAPKYEEYIPEELTRTKYTLNGNRPDFEKAIQEADLDELVGDTNKAILCKITREQDPRFREGTFVWTTIVRSTGSMYTVKRRRCYLMSNEIKNGQYADDIPRQDEMDNRDEDRIRKSSLSPYHTSEGDFIIVDLK